MVSLPQKSEATMVHTSLNDESIIPELVKHDAAYMKIRPAANTKWDEVSNVLSTR